MTILDAIIRVIHVLVGAGWLGSVYFSLTVLHPQGKALFEKEADFEQFVTGLSDGNRWRVLSAFGTTFVTGMILVALNAHHLTKPVWLGIVIAKTIIFFCALSVFYYVSWHLWPARLFAIASEYEHFQRRGTIMRTTSLILVGVDMALGVLLHLYV